MDKELESKIDLLAKEYAVKAIFEEYLCFFEDAYDSVTAIKNLNENGKFRKMREEKGLVMRGSEEDVYEQAIAASLIKTKAEIKNLLCYAISLAAPKKPIDTEVGEMGIPPSCDGALCSPRDHHPLHELATPNPPPQPPRRTVKEIYYELETFTDKVLDMVIGENHHEFGTAVGKEGVLCELTEKLNSQQADARDAEQPRLTVRLTSFPESNGKRNWTAMFVRAEPWDGLIGNAGGITIKHGELWNRVAYEAERARFLIGERDTEPYILDYSTDIQTPDAWTGETSPR